MEFEARVQLLDSCYYYNKPFNSIEELKQSPEFLDSLAEEEEEVTSDELVAHYEKKGIITYDYVID